MDDHAIRFFLAGKSERGFVSYFERLLEPGGYGAILLKGGPGSGKSTLLKKVARALSEKGHALELIPCASDPNSLDAIIDRTTRRTMIDGTAPHMLDPVYPGARDTLLHAGDAWDEALLREHQAEIMRLSDETNACHKNASAYIAAAGAVLERCRAIAARYVNHDAVRETFDTVSLPKGGESARVEHRLLSAVSVGRVAFFGETLGALCADVVAVEDEWGAASQLLLARVAAAAEEANLDAILCPCSVCPKKTEHVLLPGAGVAFTVANRFHDAMDVASRCVGGLYKPVPEREADVMRALLFHAEELIDSAGAQVALAKALHDELEAYYVAAMDFSKLDALFARAMELMS